MKIIKSTLKGDECVFSGSYSECEHFCKGNGFTILDTFKDKGIVLHQVWYDEINNVVYTICL